MFYDPDCIKLFLITNRDGYFLYTHRHATVRSMLLCIETEASCEIHMHVHFYYRFNRPPAHQKQTWNKNNPATGQHNYHQPIPLSKNAPSSLRLSSKFGSLTTSPENKEHARNNFLVWRPDLVRIRSF